MQEQRKTILVVDSCKEECSKVNQILGDIYTVIDATNAKQAISVVEKTSDVSLILLSLSDDKQLEFLFNLKHQIGRMIPVIIMVELLEREKAVKAIQFGAVDFISKPLQAELLRARVHNVVVGYQTELVEQLNYLASFNQDTGIYNKRMLFSTMKQMLKNHLDEQFIFIRLNIQHFHLYNSTMGNQEGESLLRYIAGLIRKNALEFPYIAYGQVDVNSFCICEPFHKDRLKRQMELLKDKNHPFRQEYAIDYSVGIYFIKDNNEVPDDILTKASMAAEEHKEFHGIHVNYYNKKLEEKLKREQWVAKEMKLALEDEQFQVYLQPKYDLDTEQICGSEALVRWMHPDKGMISPADFIPVFENNGFILELDYYMWEKACKILHRWKEEQSYPIYPISVNMSRISLYNPNVTPMMIKLVQKYDIEPSLLELEVTESAYMSSPELMKRTIGALREAGFTILMDDFGSGYSSLNTLKEIDVDILKVDMKFLPDGNDNSKSEKILSSIIRMAAWLETPVIAEGVETIEQKIFLEDIGCDYVQGFYYAKPMPVESYEKLIENAMETKAKLRETIDTSAIDAVLSVNPHMEELFKVISLPVSVIELVGERMELVRFNAAYKECFNQKMGLLHTGKVTKSDERKVIVSFEKARDNEGFSECEVQYLDHEGRYHWYRIRTILLCKTEKSCMVFSIYTDITNEKIYESQLQKLLNFAEIQVKKKKMLVVDDLKLSRAVLKDLFDAKFEIIEAENGRKALEVLDANVDDIAIILLDMIMPEMAGDEFLMEKNKRDAARNIPVVIISAEKDPDIQLNMLRLGVNDYITKPFDNGITEQRVENVLEYNSRFHKLIEEYRNVIAQQEGEIQNLETT